MNREALLIETTKKLNRWPNAECIITDGWAFHDSKYVHTLHNPITIDDWNRAKIVPNTKVRILSPEHSEYVQGLAFEAGFEWPEQEADFRYTTEDFLFIQSPHMTHSSDHSHFIGQKNKEIFIELPATKTPEINARVLAEKVGTKISIERQVSDQHDDLRDAHLELIRENMALKKELELTNQRNENLHRILNEIKAMADE